MHTIQLRLLTTSYDEQVLYKRFGYISTIHNLVVKYCRKALDALYADPEYQDLLKRYKPAKKAAESGEIETVRAFDDLKADMHEIIRSYGLSRSAVDAFVSVVQKNQFTKHISSQQAQKEAERVFAGVEKVLFGTGKKLHFKKWEDITTICGKCPTNGVKYFDNQHQGYIGTREKQQYIHTQDGPNRWDGMIVWNGLEIKCDIDWSDPYVRKSIGKNAVSYCEIKRIWFKSGWRYYVILYLAGDAPRKFKMGKGTAGIDPGVSTEAVDTDNQSFIEELAPKCKEYNRHIARLQRSIDRERRIANPDNYNADGTAKNGRHDWKKSNTQRRKDAEVKALYRKKSAYTNCMHRRLANRILQEADTVITEDMNFQALAKRAKKTERQDNESVVQSADGTEKTVHKFKKKKRFGKSINDRSPGLFLRIMEGKYAQYGGTFIKVDTKEFRASQYDHVKDTYIKVPLSQRQKSVGGYKVLRDLYSAFLLKHSYKNGLRPKRKECVSDFKVFLKRQETYITEAKKSNVPRLACVGF